MVTNILCGVLLYKDSWDGDSPSLTEKFVSLIILVVVIIGVILFVMISRWRKK